MAIMYKPIQSSLPDKNGRKLFYPTVKHGEKYSNDRLAEEIADYSSLSPGDVRNTLANLAKVMRSHLKASESVTLDGIGTFCAAMAAGGHGVPTSDEVSATQATLKVRFIPARERLKNGAWGDIALLEKAVCLRSVPKTKKKAGDAGEEGGDPAPPVQGGEGEEKLPDPVAPGGEGEGGEERLPDPLG
jgi:predicted histone-like DNA-binding protein